MFNFLKNLFKSKEPSPLNKDFLETRKQIDYKLFPHSGRIDYLNDNDLPYYNGKYLCTCQKDIVSVAKNRPLPITIVDGYTKTEFLDNLQVLMHTFCIKAGGWPDLIVVDQD